MEHFEERPKPSWWPMIVVLVLFVAWGLVWLGAEGSVRFDRLTLQPTRVYPTGCVPSSTAATHACPNRNTPTAPNR